MKPEEHLLSISEAADRLASKKEELKTYEYALYKAVNEAYEDDVPVFILAEILDCGRKNIYDIRKRYKLMTLQKNAALSAYKAELDSNQKFDELLASFRKESDPDS